MTMSPGYLAARLALLCRRFFIVVFGCGIALVICELSLRAYLKIEKPLVAPGVFENEFLPGGSGMYAGATVTLDRFGFRNGKHENAWEKPRKVLLLGDSVCFGQGVDDEFTIAHYMNKALADTRIGVLDLCHPGWDTPKIRNLLFREGTAHGAPARIFWLYYINDAKSSTHYLSYEQTSTWQDFPIELRALAAFHSVFKFPFWVKYRLDEYSKSTAIQKRSETWSDYYNRCIASYDAGSVTRENEERYISDVAHWKMEHAFPLELLVLPAKDQLTDGRTAPQQVMTQMGKTHGLVVHDLLDLYRKVSKDEEIFLPEDSAHLNKNGNEMVAMALLALLADEIQQGQLLGENAEHHWPLPSPR